MNFSTNQVMQFYVHDSSKGSVLDVANAVKLPNGGFSIPVTDGTNAIGRTDVVENVMTATLTAAADMAIPYTVADVTLDTNVNGGAPAVGETYVIRVSYPNIAGLGIEGWTTRVATAYASTNVAATLYADLAKALNDQFKIDGLLSADASDGTGIAISQKVLTSNELNKLYKRGVRPIVMTPFKVEAGLVTVGGVEVQPFAESSFEVVEADPTDVTPIVNGYALAEMEYFAMGERGDQYRMMGWPDVIDTEYLITPSAAYDVINIHFAHKDNNTTFQEKDLVIACAGTSSAALKTALEAKGVVFTVTKKTE